MMRLVLGLSLAFSVIPSFSLAAAQLADKGRPTTDAHGDALPTNAVARIGTIRLRHAAYVSALAFSPDGKHISSSTIWFDVGVWDTRTGRSLAFRSGRTSAGLFRAVVSPDGSLFAGRTEKYELGVQEALSGKILHRFSGKGDLCDNAVFSRDNRWLAAADDKGNTFLWDLRAGKESHHFKARPRDSYDRFCHAFTPDGRTFIQARPDDISFWNVQDGKEIRRINSKKEREWPGGAAVSPDGTLLAIHIAYGSVDIWEIKTGRHLRRIAEPWNDVGPVFSPDGTHIVTGRAAGEINFWEVQTGQLARTLNTPTEEHPTSLAFSPDGKILANGGSDHAIHLWDLASGKRLAPVSSRLGGTPSAHFLADGKTLVAHCQYDRRRNATIDERLSFWDLKGSFVREAKLAPERAHAHELSSDGRTVAYGNGPNFGFMSRPVRNGYLRSSIRLCDVASGKELVKVNDVPCQIHDLTFSPDERFLLINAFNAGPNEDDYHHIDTLQIWKRKSPDSLEKTADIPVLYFLSGYCVSPDSRWVVVTSKSGIRFHDCETGKLIRSWPDAPGSVVAVAPSGRVLVSRDARDGRKGEEVFVWEKATGKTICKLDCKSGQTDWSPLVVSPDGKTIAGCLDREVVALWDAFTGKQLGRLEGHRGDISSLCFTPDGKFLVSASADTTILIWDWKKLLKTPDEAKWSAERLEQLWQDLQANDPQCAYRAIAALAQSPAQALDLVRKKTRPAGKDEHLKYKKWINELDSDSYRVRENAIKELTQSGELAEAALRQALGRRLSLETTVRVNRVLDKLPSASLHPTTITTVRLLELLEIINTPDARGVIEELSRDTGDPIRSREAEQTLKRVKR